MTGSGAETARLVLTDPREVAFARILKAGSSFVTWPGRARLEVGEGANREGEAKSQERPDRDVSARAEPFPSPTAPSSGDTYREVPFGALIDLTPPKGPYGVGRPQPRTDFVRLGVADAVHVIGRDKMNRLDFGHGPDEFWLDADFLDAIPDDADQVFYATGVTP